ncbi:MAG: AraC family transcriptional regulator [Victivallales bacterium]
MDFSTIRKLEISRSENFRTPSSLEKKIGLWVDRIGRGADRKRIPEKLRILGLYAAVYIEEGNGIFYSEKTGEIKVGSGDTILLFPEIPNMYYPDEEWSSKWIVWNGPDAENLERLSFFRNKSPVIRGNRSAVSSAYEILSGMIDNEDTSAIFERRNVILNMLLDLYRTSLKEQDPDSISLINKALKHMSSLYDKDISIKEFADYAGLSETHFRRLFKTRTGCSPKDFIISLRISKAKEYLSAGMSIKESAARLGFNDVFYFMRLFRKVTGRAPGEFIKGRMF